MTRSGRGDAADLRFDGKVVLVTGAGNGLGYAYALAYGERGANVIVNDLGGTVEGSGSNARVADAVVAEIKRKGGNAVPDYHSVEEGAALVETAIKNFGRIDIIVNNAGILRDRSFQKMSDSDWDAVMNVHLRAAFLITKAAWPYMKKQQYGRIIMTSSPSGLYGNFGQANYSAAKLGLLGLSNTLAVEGAKYNITCNTIAPTAGSRLSASVIPDELSKALKPEYIAPLVLWLTHESCKETKGIFELGAGWVSKLRLQRTEGAVLGRNISPESVRNNWTVVTDWTNTDFPADMRESTGKLLQVVEMMKQQSEKDSYTSSHPDLADSTEFNIEKAMHHDFPVSTYTLSEKTLLLYAIGIGCDQVKQTDELQYVYEGHQKFSPFPTFFFIPAQLGMAPVMGGIPGFRFNPMMLLHAEQKIELFSHLPTTGKLSSKAKIVDVIDKKKAALAYVQVETLLPGGELLCRTTSSLFIRGKGGYGGKKTSPFAEVIVKPKKGASPDVRFKEMVPTNQAAVYRLSGDTNPLHIDPEMAKIGGFGQPILHGLCSLGYAARHVMHACSLDPSAVTKVYGRFSAPVFPGETLETLIWIDTSPAPATSSSSSSDKTSTSAPYARYMFQTRVLSRNVVAVDNGVVEIGNVAQRQRSSSGPNKSQPAENSSASKKAASAQQQGGKNPFPTTTQAGKIFSTLATSLTPEMVKRGNAVFAFQLQTAKGKVDCYTVDLKAGEGSVSYDGEKATAAPPAKKPGCIVVMSDADFAQLVLGKLDPMKAFMTGKLKVKGNIMLAQKLQVIFKPLAEKMGNLLA